MLFRKGLVAWIILLFIASELIPLTLGINITNKNNTDIIEKYGFDRYLYPEYYDCYNVSERVHRITTNTFEDNAQYNNIESATVSNLLQPPQPFDDPMNSPWPMFGHDIYHTGRCSYNTMNNLGAIIWSFWTENGVWSSPVIADDGTIYFGSPQLNAINPNGTVQWTRPDVTLQTAPVIDDSGMIYCGNALSAYKNFYAIYPNGSTKWSIYFNQVRGSPVINGDGTIIAPESDDNKIVALYSSNGTRKWEFHTNHVIYSSPAIGIDGTIYCGSHDGNIYALYPNGTLRWSLSTGTWVHGSPSIGTDGTVYCGSDDGYLYALNPMNGSVLWQLPIGQSYASPTIGPDGTLYIGVWEKKFYAINPNGTIKWIFDTSPGKVWGSTAALSGDGTLHFGTCDLEWSGGVEIIALWINGTVKWRRPLDTIFSSPAISKDGIVYIGSRTSMAEGYLNAFGPLDPNAPLAPTITGQINGKIKTIYDYTFTSSSPLGKQLYYLIDWGDDTTTDWLGPFNSGESIMMNHSWVNKGTYNIKARARDTDNLWGPWGELEITMPYSYEPQFPFIQWLLERFPNAFPILRFLLEFNH